MRTAVQRMRMSCALNAYPAGTMRRTSCVRRQGSPPSTVPSAQCAGAYMCMHMYVHMHIASLYRAE